LPELSGPLLLASLVAVGAWEERAYVSAPLAASLLTAALLVCLQRSGPLATALSLEPIRYVGKISYGLFLYHMPIFYLGEKFKPSTPFHIYAAGLFVLIFATAALSYEFVEKPFLRLKDRFERRTTTGIPAESGLAVRS